VVKGITSAVVIRVGVDFICAHSQKAWGVRNGMWYFDETRIPLWQEPQSLAQTKRVVSCCTVDLEPRQQTVLSMRTKDRSAGPAMVFETQGLPQGILLSKILVEPGQRGGFYVRAVNYSTERVTVFKNQKLGVVEPVDEFVELPAMPEKIIKEAGLLIWSQLTQMKTRKSTVGEAGARIL